jgi:pentatricopeptide repeat protein
MRPALSCRFLRLESHSILNRLAKSSSPLGPVAFGSRTSPRGDVSRCKRLDIASSRRFSTDHPVKALPKIPPYDKPALVELRDTTRQWHQSTSTFLPRQTSDTRPVTSSWTPKDVSKARFLMRQWTSNVIYPGRNSSTADRMECATQQSKILGLWLQQRLNGNPHLSEHDSQELVEMLHRCLDSWRKCLQGSSFSKRTRGAAIKEATELVDLLRGASQKLNDVGLQPNRKTYSMLLNVLSEYPQSTTACKDIMSIFDISHRENLSLDLHFYNSCLNSLARCSRYHVEAPNHAETVFQELATRNDVVADSSSLVCLLHAWASSLLPESADRAQTILEQMILKSPTMVDTTCFNVCIDAWAKHGSPEKSEALLRRMQTLHNQYRSQQRRHNTTHQLRPNAISFNSTINAWAKSSHPASAQRAEQLLNEMESRGCQPTLESYASVMESWAKMPDPGWQVQRLLDTLEQLYSEGQMDRPPSKICYLIAIQAWGRTASMDHPGPKKSPPECAEMLLRRMQDLHGCRDDRSDLQPCVVVYTCLINAWGTYTIASDAPDRAMKVYEEMQELARAGRKDAAPNSITLNALLSVFLSHGRVDEARRLLYDRNIGCAKPDMISYYKMLTAYAKRGCPNAAAAAQELVTELERECALGNLSLKPTSQLYALLLVAWGNNRGHDSAARAEKEFWNLFQKQKDGSDVTVTTGLVNCVLRAWSKSSEGGAAERAEAFLMKVLKETTGSAGEVAVDTITHLHLIQAWARSRRSKAHLRAEKYLDDSKTISTLDGCGGRITRAHFNAVILAWSRSRDRNALSSIEKHLDEMRSWHKRGYDTSPDDYTIHLYVKTILETDSKGRSSLAAEFIKDICKDGSGISQATQDLIQRIPH